MGCLFKFVSSARTQYFHAQKCENSKDWSDANYIYSFLSNYQAQRIVFHSQ